MSAIITPRRREAFLPLGIANRIPLGQVWCADETALLRRLSSGMKATD
jgi:hypothetical protein